MSMRYRINPEESGVTDEVLRRINLFYTISGVLAFILGLIVLVYSIILGHFLIGILLGILIFSVNIYFYEVIGSRFLKKQVYPKCSSCLLYTSPSPRDLSTSRMPSSA